MIVQILQSCKHTGVKKGEIYKAERYWLDPYTKVRLITRLDKEGNPVGEDPSCAEYLSNVKVLDKDLFDKAFNSMDELTKQIYG